MGSTELQQLPRAYSTVRTGADVDLMGNTQQRRRQRATECALSQVKCNSYTCCVIEDDGDDGSAGRDKYFNHDQGIK
jgi:hypothetical protein